MEFVYVMFFQEPIIWFKGDLGLSFVGAAWIFLPVALALILGKLLK